MVSIKTNECCVRLMKSQLELDQVDNNNNIFFNYKGLKVPSCGYDFQNLFLKMYKWNFFIMDFYIISVFFRYSLAKPSDP